MPNINLTGTDGDLGNRYISKEYLMSVYPQIANQLITPELWVWGRNYRGQLGVNDAGLTLGRTTPVTTIAGGANWKQVSCGNGFTAAIKTDGTLWTWGRNSYSQLGINSSINPICTPVTTFAGGTTWKQVFCGNFYTAAIKTDGTLWTWGYNFYGSLGVNDTVTRSTPVTTFAGGTNWKQVSCGNFYTAAIKTDGTLWTFGDNVSGQLGINNTSQRNTPVTTFAGGTNWKQVSGGGYFASAIKTDGTLWSWGSNYYGELGVNNTTSPIRTPVTTFAGGTNWKQVACGRSHITAIKTDGTLWTWGRNSYGRLGDNTVINRSTPITTFAGGTNWKQVTCGYQYTAAIKTDGTLWTWGSNNRGQLGDNTAFFGGRSTPVTTFAGGTNWKQVFCAIDHIAAIKTSDDLQGI